MANNRHWLALLAAATVVAISSTAVGDIDPMPAQKCCKPAAVAPPATGCTTSCLPSVTCAQGRRAGSVTNGVCNTAPVGECTLTTGLSAAQPLFACTSVDCNIDATTPGKKCQWTYAGGSPTNTVTFNDCSGTLCN